MAARTLIMYHANCPDGWASAYITARATKAKETDLFPASYDHYTGPLAKMLTEVNDETDVFIVDFSLPQDELLNLAKLAKNVVVFDHHESARDKLAALTFKWRSNYREAVDREITIRASLELPPDTKLPRVYFDMTRCGAEMCADYFDTRISITLLAEYVGDRDLWLWQLPNSREINAYLSSVPRTLDAWAQIDFSASNMKEYAAIGAALLRTQSLRVDSAVKSSVTVLLPLDGTDVALQGMAVNCTADHSEVGERLLEMAGTDFALIYNINADRTVKCSVRSKHGCAKRIAERFKGGGHPNAAGFTLPNFGTLVREFDFS